LKIYDIFIEIIKEDTSIYMTPIICDYLEDYIDIDKLERYIENKII